MGPKIEIITNLRINANVLTDELKEYRKLELTEEETRILMELIDMHIAYLNKLKELVRAIPE